MPNYKAVDAERLDAAMTATADAIREKTSGTDPIPWNAETGFAEAVAGITSGGAAVAVSVPMKDVNFYDYDGTRLYSYTVAEAAALTELPPLPTQPGLICQGWNWTLDGIKAMGREVDVGATYITDDGKTRIYITLTEGRTSPMLGCCPNGTVTVDWGDGSTPDVLTGTSTGSLVWTPTHNYSVPGDYVITLTVDGSMEICGSSTENQGSAFLRFANGTDARNKAYHNTVTKVELGSGITSLGMAAFYSCTALQTITIPESINLIGVRAFQGCLSLRFLAIPKQVTRLYNFFATGCCSLAVVSLPDGITAVGIRACEDYARPPQIVLPNSITSFGAYAFVYCAGLTSVVIPQSLASIAASVFAGCTSVRYYDFTRCTAVPTLANANAFEEIPDDCEIRVPAALADEWKAATNWATYADYIVEV